MSPYVADGEFDDFAEQAEAFVDEGQKRITRRSGEMLHDGVTEKTPVAEIPEAYQGNLARFMRDRRARRPGSLKKSWRTSVVREEPGDVLAVTVDTDDPVAPHVEWDTKPHPITPRKPGGWLRFPVGPRFVFAKRVSHPGTTGVHMMRDAEAELDVEWPREAERILDALATELNRRT